MKETASDGAEMNYPNLNLDLLHFLVTTPVLRLVQQVKLDLCKKTDARGAGIWCWFQLPGQCLYFI